MGLRSSKVSAQKVNKRAWSFWGAGNRDKGKARSGRKHRGNANLVRAGQVVLGGQTCRLIPAISLNLFCLDSSRCAGTLYYDSAGWRMGKKVQRRSARAMRRRSASLPKSGVHEIDFGEHDDESTRTRGRKPDACTHPPVVTCWWLLRIRSLRSRGLFFPEVSHCAKGLVRVAF
jgi:hypothetical protein